MAEPTQQQQVSEGTGSNVQWAADHVAPAPGVVTQVRSETTTYATDGDRFVERHEVLAGPLGEEEGYVEKREGHLGIPSGGVVEEVEEEREIGLLEPEGKLEDEGGEKDGESAEKREDAGAETGGEGTHEPTHSLAETPVRSGSPAPTGKDAAASAKGGDAADVPAPDPAGAAKEREAENVPGPDPAGAAKEREAESAAAEDDVSLVDSDRKRKAGKEHEDGEEEAKKQKGGEGEKRGRGRPAKGEANGKVGKEPVEGTRRSTRTKKSE